jgi:hypothetical protein
MQSVGYLKILVLPAIYAGCFVEFNYEVGEVTCRNTQYKL